MKITIKDADKLLNWIMWLSIAMAVGAGLVFWWLASPEVYIP